jgi:hypothetical protein
MPAFEALYGIIAMHVVGQGDIHGVNITAVQNWP